MQLRIPHRGWLLALLLASGVPMSVSAAPLADVTYTVKPGDTLLVSVWKEPDLQGPVLVRPDGQFSFPLAGQMDARNKTVTELQTELTAKLKKFISDPVVTVSIQEIKGNKVYVIGQVQKPGDFVVNPRVATHSGIATCRAGSGSGVGPGRSRSCLRPGRSPCRRTHV